LLLDEYKSTIKRILQYLLNHSSAERDQILLEFHDLFFSSGKSRFATKFELVPLLEAMMGASIRLQDFDKLIIVLGDLSNAFQMLGEEEKTLYYSNLQEEVTCNRQSESVKKILESISQGNREDKQVSDVVATSTSESMLSVLEEL
jgi:DNA-binding ferritin-like protein (Dps family)